MRTGPRRAEVDLLVRSRGRELSVRHRAGAPGRVPLVLCNGIGSGLELFDPLVEVLDPGRPVVRFDPPGIGRSAPARLPYRFATLAAAVHRVVRHLGYPRADLLGLSWGGGLAQQYAFQYPRACRRVVLAATATGSLMVPAAPRTLARMLTPRRHRDPAYARAVAGDLYGGAARADPHAAVTALGRTPRPASVPAYLHQLQAITGWSSLPFLPLVRQPVLVLAGDDDPIVPGLNGEVMALLLPRGRLHRYGGGHLELVTGAGRLAPVIERFLDAPAGGTR